MMKRLMIALTLAYCTGTLYARVGGVRTDSFWKRGNIVGVVWDRGYSDSVCIDVYDVGPAMYHRLAIVAPEAQQADILVPGYIGEGALVRLLVRRLDGALLEASRWYTVIVPDAFKVVTPPDEVERSDSLSEPLTIIPNPATESVTIEIDRCDGGELVVLDFFGRTMVQLELREGCTAYCLPCTDWMPGRYRVEVRQRSGRCGQSFLVVR
jgi:hypothetical protein